MAQQPTGILNKGAQSKDAQVSINAPNAKERGASKEPVDAPPNPKEVTAPAVNAPIKDEVELLRSGVMNKHGEHVKTHYFELYSVPDNVVLHIFQYLEIPDLVSIMSLCRRFYRIGKMADVWESFDKSNLTIGQFALHRLLERRVEKIRLSGAKIFAENINYSIPVEKPFHALLYLDFSHAVYSNPTILSSILERISNLEVLNIAHFPYITNVLCLKISQNTKLKYLNMEMCGQFSPNGIKLILSSCKRLCELNLGWAQFDDHALRVLSSSLPSSLTHLNLAGMNKKLTDTDVECIVQLCPNLLELELPDCGELTSETVKSVNTLTHIQRVSFSRCFGIEPTAFLELHGIEALNIHGCITKEGVEFLRKELYPTIINETPLSSIARPSFGYFNRSQ